MEARGDVHLDQPRLQVTIEHDVKTKQLVDAVSVGGGTLVKRYNAF